MIPPSEDELQLPAEIGGYPRLAGFQGRAQEYAIFRKFSVLNMLNLLFLQAELVHVESKLKKFAEDGPTWADMLRQEFFMEWPGLEDEHDHRWRSEYETEYETIMAMRNRLREYNEALIQLSQLNTLVSPLQAHQKTLKEWLCRPTNRFIPDGGDVRALPKPWVDLDSTNGDFVSLNPTIVDPFTRRVIHTLIRYYHILKGKRAKKLDLETGMYEYSDTAITRVGDAFAIALSTVIPICSMVVLYYTRVLLWRFFVALGFALLLAVMLWSLSSAKRGEVFALSTAFLAIEVVFIGNANLS